MFVFACGECDCLSKCVVLCKYIVVFVVARLELFLACGGISAPYKYSYYYLFIYLFLFLFNNFIMIFDFLIF